MRSTASCSTAEDWGVGSSVPLDSLWHKVSLDSTKVVWPSTIGTPGTGGERRAWRREGLQQYSLVIYSIHQSFCNLMKDCTVNPEYFVWSKLISFHTDPHLYKNKTHTTMKLPMSGCPATFKCMKTNVYESLSKATILPLWVWNVLDLQYLTAIQVDTIDSQLTCQSLV